MGTKKNEAKPFIIIICVLLGIFLVGFGIWYGIQHFKDKGDEPNIPDNPIVRPDGGTTAPDNPALESKERINNRIVGNKLEFVSYFYKSSKEIISSINGEDDTKCYNTSIENGILTVTYEDNEKYKFSEINEEIKCVCFDGDEGSITAYILAKSGNLYVSSFEWGDWNNNKTKALPVTKMSSNISSVIIKDQGVADLTVPVIFAYILDDSGNYYLYNMDYVTKKQGLEKTKKPDDYLINIVLFDSSNIKNNKLIYNDIEVDYVFVAIYINVANNENISDDELYCGEYTYIVGKDNYLYGAYLEENSSNVKIEKLVDRRIKSIDYAKNKENIISMEFE